MLKKNTKNHKIYLHKYLVSILIFVYMHKCYEKNKKTLAQPRDIKNIHVVLNNKKYSNLICMHNQLLLFQKRSKSRRTFQHCIYITTTAFMHLVEVVLMNTKKKTKDSKAYLNQSSM